MHHCLTGKQTNPNSVVNWQSGALPSLFAWFLFCITNYYPSQAMLSFLTVSGRACILSSSGFIRKWPCTSKVCLVCLDWRRSGPGDSSAGPTKAQWVFMERLICSKGLWAPSSVQLQAILLVGLVINTFTYVSIRSLRMGPGSGMVTRRRGRNAWRGCNTISGNLLTRESSSAKLANH